MDREKLVIFRVSANITTQTVESVVSDKSCNTTEQQSKHVQTTSTESSTSTELDMAKLAQWLNQIYPNVKRQIENTNNKVFKNYRLLDDNLDATCRLIQELKIENVGETSDKALPMVVAASWNVNGKILGVACSFKHRSWCYHHNQVLIYPLIKCEKLSDIPKKRLNTESCITVLKFHPTNENILAAGTFTGHIYFWNIDNDIDPLLCNMSIHEQAVTQLSWIIDETSKSFDVVTSSSDGILKLWSFANKTSNLSLKTVFKIKPPIFGKFSTSINASKELANYRDIGVICFDFSKHIPDLFVLALEGGLIAKCSLLGGTKIKGPDKNISTFDPVYKYYQPHKGEIASIKFSTSVKDMFLTCGTDGEIRIYLIEQDDPAQIIFTKSALHDLSFIPHEQRILAACGQKGYLEAFDLITGKSLNVAFDVKVIKRTLTSLAINHKRENYTVIGNDIGEIQLWDIPWNILK
ncbi:cytoplasmic dynein 2 intermediate chain 2-like isoform X2 [Rhynchophorus ferrugineus]|uniref:cytoplasmic dynein 2 intermediate chain 2-like isoform X2 n=1 Tax=Rhynchophorus ferrugineus TaxID=354439 RepID=UPI003FCE33C0